MSSATAATPAPPPTAPNRVSSSGHHHGQLDDVSLGRDPLPVEKDIMQLARLGEIGAIQKLFDSREFDANYSDEQGITPLHWAAINNHHALCHFLIRSGANVNARGGDAAATPVLWAAKRCHYYIVNLLLRNGADPLLADDQGYNLLHSATLDGNVYQIVMLLHEDIPIDAPDAQSHTSLMWAAYKGFPQCVDILLKWGASVYATDEQGFTALHWALVKGSLPCIQKLIEYGADRFVQSNEGKSPAVTAKEMNSMKQWHRALAACGYDEDGNPETFPLSFIIKDRRGFVSKFFFLWPFLVIFCALYVLSNMVVYAAVPITFVTVFCLQWTAQQLLRWAPSDMNHMQRTPFLAGVFAGTSFWVGVRWIVKILPSTYLSNPFFNLLFAASYGLCVYFYFMTMLEDPGFVPKPGSRHQQKAIIEELLASHRYDEQNFCVSCMVRKPLRNLEVLPNPTETHCAILGPSFCVQLSKDPFTLITNAWGILQLIWVTMLLFVQLIQIARAQTTYESMRGHGPANAATAAITSGALSADGASLGASGMGPDPNVPPHHRRKKTPDGCFEQWKRLLGLDTFVATALHGSRANQVMARRRRENPFSRGVLTNCRDFWADGAPVFGKRQNGQAALGGQPVNYARMYEVPPRMRAARGGDAAYMVVDGGEDERV
ncbi:hypothetical protein LTR04_000982 [Oleoguttula sp. CCFEE 6159]|nr:hypothetical protein LTR04_000982 [Oleoguttula sp. CCFEE 6159]